MLVSLNDKELKLAHYAVTLAAVNVDETEIERFGEDAEKQFEALSDRLECLANYQKEEQSWQE